MQRCIKKRYRSTQEERGSSVVPESGCMLIVGELARMIPSCQLGQTTRRLGPLSLILVTVTFTPRAAC